MNHDILMREVARTVRDKRMLNLTGAYLRAGYLEDGRKHATPKGPRGRCRPCWPIYLDMLDKELEAGACRSADTPMTYIRAARRQRFASISVIETPKIPSR
ncbi:MAG: hypothetical protein R2684_14050 [Pyrinomonadaceae bacterium]